MSSIAVKRLLLVAALLLAANLLRPILAPVLVSAEEEAVSKPELAASGSIAWVLKGNQLYYVKFEQDFDAIKVYRPEKLERDRDFVEGPAELAASGNVAWEMRDEKIYYAKFEEDFDAIKIYRPEKLDR